MGAGSPRALVSNGIGYAFRHFYPSVYPVRIYESSDLRNPDHLDVRVNMAIEKALWYLHTQQRRAAYGAVPVGYWTGDHQPNRRHPAANAAQQREYPGLHIGFDGGLDQLVGKAFKFGSRERFHQVLGHPVHRHDIRKIDLGT